MAKLGIDLVGLLWQAVAFGLLVFLLHRFMYKTVLRIIDERAAKVRRGMDDAERARQRAQEADAEFDQRLTEARRKAQEVVADASRAGDKVRAEMLDQAKQEQARILQETRQQVEAEQQQALQAVRSQIIDLSIDLTRKVLQQSVDEQTQRRLIEQFVGAERPDEGTQ